MRNNGFTLIELIATIALIAILGVISIGIVTGSFSNAKNELDNYQKETIKSTAELYFDDNVTSLNSGTEYYYIYIKKDLVDNNYLEQPKNGDSELLYGKITLKITWNNDVITKVNATDIEISNDSSIEEE